MEMVETATFWDGMYNSMICAIYSLPLLQNAAVHQF